MKKKLTDVEQRRINAEKAMPDLNAVIKKHGYEVVNYAFSQQKEKQKKLRELETKRQEVSRLELELNQ